MSDTASSDDAARRNLINFAALLFTRMAEKYGGSTTLNELTMLNYGFVCSASGKDICVTQASEDLQIPKSSVSRILTGMRAKGFVTEETHPHDRRRRIFKLAPAYLQRGDDDIEKFLAWCREPGHSLV